MSFRISIGSRKRGKDVLTWDLVGKGMVANVLIPGFARWACEDYWKTKVEV